MVVWEVGLQREIQPWLLVLLLLLPLQILLRLWWRFVVGCGRLWGRGH